MTCTRFAGVRTTLLVSAIGVLASACGSDGPAAPRTGALAISSTAQTTSDNTTFDYTIAIDNGTPRTIAASSPTRYVVDGLSIGAHTVAIRGLAPGCSAANDTRSANVVGGDTVDVAFAIVCSRTTGDIAVSVTTTGVELDADGYGITLDGTSAGAIIANGSTVLRTLQPGSRVVGITGLASNCTATAATKPAVVTAGVSTAVTFDVTCRARTAVMRFNVTTNGDSPDANGYLLVIDGMGFRLPVNGVFRLLGVPLGERFVIITDVANNCAMLFAPVQAIDITVADTVVVPIDVACTANTEGSEIFSAVDPENDTLPNADNEPDPAIDLRLSSGRHAAGWMTLTFRFASTVVPAARFAANSLNGFVELDTDENSATGSPPGIRAFGGNAVQGVDAVIFMDEDSTQAYVLRDGNLVGSVGLRFARETMIMSVPLALLRDDGNLSLTAVFGTGDRPTDIAPNAGVILSRRPAAATAEHVSRTQDRPAARPSTTTAQYRDGLPTARQRTRRWMP